MRPGPSRHLFFVVGIFLCAVLFALTSSTRAQTKPENAKALLVANQPLSFEPNRGQANVPADFIVRAPGLAVGLRQAGVTLRLGGGAGDSARMGLTFVGGNSAAEAVASEKQSSYTNYLLGNDPSRWLTHIPNFARVTYQGIYPGVDVAYYGNHEQLEHDFIVGPYADYRVIRMRVDGPRRLELQADGTLKVFLPGGNLSFGRPEVYQSIGGQKILRNGHYVLLGENEFGFEIGDYDRSKPLVIDPVLTYSTYLAHVSVGISGVAVDTQGNTYVTGLAPASDFPAASNTSLCKVCPNSAAVFVGKMNASGTGYVYSTFFGGSGTDQPVGIAVDQNGNAVVTGNTTSNDFPVKNPVMTIVPNNNDLSFITSLSPDGSSLNYSSLLGGGTQQQNGPSTFVGGVAVDSNGNAYISGITDSPAFPVTTLHVVTPAYPNNVVFVTKFLPTGAIGYSALLGDVSPTNGGGGLIGVMGIAIDPTGSAYIAGAGGTLWPTTTGAFQTTIPGAVPFAAPFVTKLSADGTSVTYSTFLGDSGPRPTGIAVNSTGDAFVTGDNADSSFPTTMNAYEPTFGTNTCCAPFLTEFNATGTQLLYSSFFYGTVTPNTVTTSTSGIALDGSGGIWITGTSGDPNFPLVLPVQSMGEGFVSRFNPAGSQLTFSTFIGGTEGSFVSGIAIDANGKAHVAGTTTGGLFTTPGAYISTVTAPPPNVQFIYGYAEVIDTSVASPSVCFSQQSIFFGTRLVGTPVSQTVTLTNCGNSQLLISGITSPPSAFTVPAASNGCLQPLGIDATCTFTVTFTPAAIGPTNTTITITSNAAISSTQFFVSGAGSAPIIEVQPPNVVFDPQFVGQTSPPQFVFITNGGAVPLHIDLVHTTITAGFAFTQSGCDQPIFPQSNSHCGFLLRFTAGAAGTQTGTFSIASDDPAHPMFTVGLTGMSVSSYPVPTLIVVSPPTVPIGGGSVTLQVSGTNFFPASVVYVGGVAQPTTYTFSGGLTATVSGSTFASLGEFPVTVFNPGPGGGESAPLTLTSYQAITMSATALVYDPTTSLLYAAIGTGAANNANTVAVVDPVTVAVKQFVTVGNDPEKLALSSDGQFLYVAVNGDHKIQRINTTTLAIDETFALPTLGEVLTVQDMKVVPGSPNSLVVALAVPGGSPGEAGIALFSSGALVNFLPDDFADHFPTVDSFDFAGTPSVVYSLPLSISGAFGVFTIDGSGIHLQSSGTSGTTTQTTGSIVVSDGTLLYTNSGQVYNPSPQTLVKTYNPPLFFAPSVVPKTSVGRTFFINQLAQSDDFAANTVQAYDQAGLTVIGGVPFLESVEGGASNLALWGTNGFAFIGGGSPTTSNIPQLILFRSSISGVASGQNPFPVLASLGTSSALSGGPGFSLSVIGSNFVNGSTVQWKGSARTTTFVSATQLNANITAADIAAPGTALITVLNPAPGGGLSSPLTFTIPASPAAAVLSTTSLVFSSQLVSSTSTAQFVTLTNPGGMQLSITGGVQITGDFAQTNSCALSLASQGSCVISVTFTPAATGTRTGTITITDNAGNSPQTVSLTGTGTIPDFTFATGGSTTTTATVTSGQTASYTLSLLAAASFNGNVGLTCGQIPVNARCTVTPSSLALAGGKASSFTVTVATSLTSTSLLLILQIVLVVCCFGCLIGSPVAWKSGRIFKLTRARAYGFAAVLVYLLIATAIAGCGGASITTPPPPTTTPAGTYTLQIVATGGTTTQSQSITLIVQ